MGENPCGALALWQGGIANETVYQRIAHLDAHTISALPYESGDVQLPRTTPNVACLLAIDYDMGNAMQARDAKQHLFPHAWCGPRRGTTTLRAHRIRHLPKSRIHPFNRLCRCAGANGKEADKKDAPHRLMNRKEKCSFHDVVIFFANVLKSDKLGL